MADGLIREIAAPEVPGEIQNIIDLLEKADEATIKWAKDAKNVEIKFKGVDTLEGLYENTQKATEASKGLSDSTAAYNKAVQQADGVLKKYNQTIQQSVNLYVDLKGQLKAVQESLGTTQAAIDKETASTKTNLQQTKQLQEQKQQLVTQEKELVTAVKDTSTVLTEQTKQFQLARTAVEAYEESSLSLALNIDSLKTSISEINASMAIYKKQLEDEKITEQEYREAIAPLIVRQAEYNVELQATQALLKNAAKEQYASMDSIEAARAQVGLLTKERNSLNLSTEEGITRQKELNAQIDQYNAFIRENVDAYQKQKINIGNYPTVKAELTAINTELEKMYLNGQKDSEEFQVLTARAQELKGAMTGVKEELAANTTIGEKFNSVIQRMGLRFVANLVIFQAAIELFEAFKGKWQEYTDRLNVQQNTLSKIAATTTGNFIAEAAQIDALKQRFNDASSTIEDKKEVMNELNTVVDGQVTKMTNLNQVNQFFKDKAGEFIEAITLRAKAVAALSVITENTQKELQLLADPKSALSGLDKLGIAINSFSEGVLTLKNPKDLYDWYAIAQGAGKANEQINSFRESTKLATQELIRYDNEANAKDKKLGTNTSGTGIKNGKDPKETVNATLDANKQLLEAQSDLDAQRYKQDADANKTIVDDEKANFDDRIAAAQQFYQDQIDLITLANGKEVAVVQAKIDALDKKEELYRSGSIKLNKDQLNAIIILRQAYETKLQALDEDGNTKLLQAYNNHNKSIEKITQDNIQYRIDALKKISDNVDLQEAAAQQKLLDSYKNDEISYGDYLQQKKALDDKYQLEKKNEIIAYLQEEIGLLSKQGIDTKLLQDLLNKALKEGYDQDVKNFTDAENQKKIVKQKIGDELKQLATETISLIQTVQDAQYQKQIAQDEQKIKDIEAQKQADIDSVNASVASQEDKEKQINDINARAAVQEKQIQNDENRRKQQQANADKQAAIENIILNTAVAVSAALGMKPWTPLNLVLAGTVAAVGLVELAKAEAASPPQYFDGVDNHPGGLAIVGDGGEPEKIIEPGKQPYWSDSVPTLMDLPAGTEVIPQHKLLQDAMMFGVPILPHYNDDSDRYKNLEETFKKEIRALVGAVKNKPETIFEYRNGEIRKTVKKGSSRISWINQNYH